jgi:hypothetical protein
MSVPSSPFPLSYLPFQGHSNERDIASSPLGILFSIQRTSPKDTEDLTFSLTCPRHGGLLAVLLFYYTQLQLITAQLLAQRHDDVDRPLLHCGEVLN